jgi:hypothetical protein
MEKRKLVSNRAIHDKISILQIPKSAWLVLIRHWAGGFFHANENQFYVQHSSENLELPIPNKQLDNNK